MKEKLEELKSIIYGMDALLENWFDGYNAACMAADGDDVYAQADNYRNRALAILEEMENEKE